MLSLDNPMNPNLDPEELEAATGVKRALLELQYYATSHTISPAMSKSIEALVAAGAITPETSAFIANHHVRFYGFDPGRTGQEVPVLDVVLVGRAAPIRCVGFADGHVERVPLEKRL